MKKDENNIPYYDLINERSTDTFFKASEMTLDPGCYRFNWWINEDITNFVSGVEKNVNKAQARIEKVLEAFNNIE